MRQTNRERGVALVITLIFLSVITVMVVAFLALSRRGRVAIRESTNRTIAERMADTALERAKAEFLARILSSGSPDFMGPGLMVSVNDTNWLVSNPYDDTDEHVFVQDIVILTNLLEDPRPPVFVDTNKNGTTGPLEFRYYYDLNRNGRPETNGSIRVVDNLEDPVFDDVTGEPVFMDAVGDPEWVGSLWNPAIPHAQTNKFDGRWAFAIIPVGRGLDLNAIHNEAKRLGLRGFYRNQGIAPFEINMAAFLTDLNTNQWFGYDYNIDLNQESDGVAFTDATALTYHRYMGDYTSLDTFADLFPDAFNLPRATVYAQDFIDGYSDSVYAAFGLTGADEVLDPDNTGLPWPGAPNRTNYFTPHDLFGPASSPEMVNFINRLRAASQGLSTYDQYTFYRLLAQLGTDSKAESEIRLKPEDKINLNYINIPAAPDGIVKQQLDLGGNPVVHSPTNFLSWAPTNFFNAVADEMIRKEFAFFGTNLGVGEISITNFPVFVSGSTDFVIPGVTNIPFYHPRLHQILQVTANICDATRADKEGEDYPYLPTVFYPIVTTTLTNQDLYVRGYAELNSPVFHSELTNSSSVNAVKWFNLKSPNSRPSGAIRPGLDFFYELPMIVGAKKGYPNFNEYVVQTSVHVSRKLELVKARLNAVPTQTNHMFIMGISNAFAIEAWYSYTNGMPSNYFPRATKMWAATSISSTLSNEFGVVRMDQFGTNFTRTNFNPTVDITRAWGGSRPETQFQIMGPNLQVVLSNSVYRPTVRPPDDPFELVGPTNRFDDSGIYTNQWTLILTNRLLYFLFDMEAPNGPHVVDAVSINGMETRMNISKELSKSSGPNTIANTWDNSIVGDTTQGVINQMMVSLGVVDSGSDWTSYGAGNLANGTIKNKEIDRFRLFVDPGQTLFPTQYFPTNQLPPTGLRHQAPFSPSKQVVQLTSWQVDDPLVHYTMADLHLVADEPIDLLPGQPISIMNDSDLGKKNGKYNPWGGPSGGASGYNSGANFDLSVKDPGMWTSDHWQFPDQKFPNLGWLGRVHRGTPWQTLYLKSTVAENQAWLRPNGPGVDLSTHPTNDYRWVDLFTTSLHPNLTRGRLSVNQTNLASWSAVLAGMPVTTLGQDPNGNPFLDETIIQPTEVGGLDGLPLLEIVDGITRAQTNAGPFRCLAEILSVPELTVNSPYLRDPFVQGSEAVSRRHEFLRDSDYERIPQQVLSLLTPGEARFVVYAFGQSLTPEDAVRSGGAAFGMPINYRITGEVATRAVLRVEYDRLSDDPLDPLYRQFDYTRPHVVVEQFNILPPF